MAAYDPGYSAFNPDAAAPRNDVTVRWETKLPARPTGRPIVAAGTVFLPTAAGLMAYALADGTKRWRVGEDHSWPPSPIVHDGTVYAGHSDQPGPTIRALDANDGSEIWSYDTRGDVRVSPVPVVDNDGHLHALYAGDDTGRVYKFDPENGSVEHHTDLFGEVTQLAFRRYLLVGTGGGEIYALYDSGDRLQGLWRRKLGGKITAVTTRDAALFVATFGGPVYRLSDGAHAGRSRWTNERGASDLAATAQDIVASDDSGIRAYHYQTGEEQWQIDGGFNAAPAIAGDLLIAGGGNVGEHGGGFIAAYGMRGSLTDSILGRSRWTFETDEAVMEGVTVADGAVFAATQGADEPARLYVLDPA